MKSIIISDASGYPLYVAKEIGQRILSPYSIARMQRGCNSKIIPNIVECKTVHAKAYKNMNPKADLTRSPFISILKLASLLL